MPAEAGPGGEGLVLEAEALPPAIPDVHDLMDRLWAGLPAVPESDRLRFATAVAEVAANIVEHAARAAPTRMRLVLSGGPERVSAQFEDDGLPYEPTAAPDADPMAESGRGLAMARALADEVVYERVGSVNRWRVVRRLGD